MSRTGPRDAFPFETVEEVVRFLSDLVANTAVQATTSASHDVAHDDVGSDVGVATPAVHLHILETETSRDVVADRDAVTMGDICSEEECQPTVVTSYCTTWCRSRHKRVLSLDVS